MIPVLARHLLVALGYWMRPYDMLADRRRWRWQRPAACGLPPGYGLRMLQDLTPGQRAELLALKHRLAARRDLSAQVSRTPWPPEEQVPATGWAQAREDAAEEAAASRERIRLYETGFAHDQCPDWCVGCTCHSHPPCGHCTDHAPEEMNA